MNVQELIDILQTLPKDLPVCVNDRGIFTDLGYPEKAYTMNGECLLLSPGVYDKRGYVVNFSSRVGYEMVLNDDINAQLASLPYQQIEALDNEISALGYGVYDECIMLGALGIKDKPYDTIGPRCPRNFDPVVYEVADRIMTIIRKYL